jgi:tetratricopeptide (TPR) repeat protein
LLVLNQNPEEGVKLLRDALRADPSLSDAHYYLASGLMSLGQDPDAIHEFELAIAADPTNNRAMSSYYKLAQLYRKLHDTPNAQTAMQNFLRMRAQSKAQQDRYDAQVVRKRTELPVADPEKIAMSDEPGAK